MLVFVENGAKTVAFMQSLT